MNLDPKYDNYLLDLISLLQEALIRTLSKSTLLCMQKPSTFRSFTTISTTSMIACYNLKPTFTRKPRRSLNTSASLNSFLLPQIPCGNSPILKGRGKVTQQIYPLNNPQSPSKLPISRATAQDSSSPLWRNNRSTSFMPTQQNVAAKRPTATDKRCMRTLDR